MIKRPMLASPTKEENLRALRYPYLASYKIDGVRAVVINGVLMSRTMKPIPNKYTQELFGRKLFEGLDGELVVGDAFDHNCMQHTMSGVMSFEGQPNVTWHIFDKWNESGCYHERARMAKAYAGIPEYPTVTWISHKLINNYEELAIYEEQALNLGYEGIMLRSLSGPYKQGRSTLREGYLLKVKRFDDDEAEVIGYTEQMHNDNEATTDARGYTKRSTHAEGKRAAGTLGALQVRDIRTGVEFDIGTGFTAEQRLNLWEGRKYLPGKLVKYKHFRIGVKDKPRFPVFLGFRDRRDM